MPKPLAVRVQYHRPWPQQLQIIPEDRETSQAEIAEYWTFCTGEQLAAEHISEAQRWQFAARKNEYFLDENIPYQEKNDWNRSLLAWHPIVCKYYPLGPEPGDGWLKAQARRCMALEAFEVEFMQPLSVGEPPKPVPETVLKEIRQELQQHLQQQQVILAHLRRQRVPLWVQAGKEMKLLWPEEICFITSETKTGIAIFTVSGDRWPSFQTLSFLEQQLMAEPAFMRTSRQHLVNLDRIALVQPAGRGRDLTFAGLPPDIKARVTDGYLKAFLERLKG